MILPGRFWWVPKFSVPRLLGSRRRVLMLSPSAFWPLSLHLVKVPVLRQALLAAQLSSILIMKRMNCKGEPRAKHHYVQNELVRAHLSPLVPENAPIEGKIDFKLSWLLFACSSALSCTAKTQGRLCPSGPPLQHSHASSRDLQCPFAHFWHIKQFVTSRAVLSLLFFFPTEIFQIFFFNSPHFCEKCHSSAEAGIYAFKTNLHSYYSCSKEGSKRY